MGILTDEFKTPAMRRADEEQRALEAQAMKLYPNDGSMFERIQNEGKRKEFLDNAKNGTVVEATAAEETQAQASGLSGNGTLSRTDLDNQTMNTRGFLRNGDKGKFMAAGLSAATRQAKAGLDTEEPAAFIGANDIGAKPVVSKADTDELMDAIAAERAAQETAAPATVVASEEKQAAPGAEKTEGGKQKSSAFKRLFITEGGEQAAAPGLQKLAENKLGLDLITGRAKERAMDAIIKEAPFVPEHLREPGRLERAIGYEGKGRWNNNHNNIKEGILKATQFGYRSELPPDHPDHMSKAELQESLMDIAESTGHNLGGNVVERRLNSIGRGVKNSVVGGLATAAGAFSGSEATKLVTTKLGVGNNMFTKALGAIGLGKAANVAAHKLMGDGADYTSEMMDLLQSAADQGAYAALEEQGRVAEAKQKMEEIEDKKHKKVEEAKAADVENKKEERTTSRSASATSKSTVDNAEPMTAEKRKLVLKDDLQFLSDLKNDKMFANDPEMQKVLTEVMAEITKMAMMDIKALGGTVETPQVDNRTPEEIARAEMEAKLKDIQDRHPNSQVVMNGTGDAIWILNNGPQAEAELKNPAPVASKEATQPELPAEQIATIKVGYAAMDTEGLYAIQQGALAAKDYESLKLVQEVLRERFHAEQAAKAQVETPVQQPEAKAADREATVMARVDAALEAGLISQKEVDAVFKRNEAAAGRGEVALSDERVVNSLENLVNKKEAAAEAKTTDTPTKSNGVELQGKELETAQAEYAKFQANQLKNQRALNNQKVIGASEAGQELLNANLTFETEEVLDIISGTAISQKQATKNVEKVTENSL